MVFMKVSGVEKVLKCKYFMIERDASNFEKKRKFSVGIEDTSNNQVNDEWDVRVVQMNMYIYVRFTVRKKPRWEWTQWILKARVVVQKMVMDKVSTT